MTATEINWKSFCKYADEIKDFVARGNKVYCLTSKQNSNYRIIEVTLPDFDFATAREVYAGDEWIIESISEAKDYLLITLMKNGVEFIVKKMSFETGKIEDVVLPLTGKVNIAPYSVTTNECRVYNSSWTSPGNYYHLDLHNDEFEKGGFYVETVFEGSENIVAEEVEVESHDGVKVPLSIAYDKNLLKKDSSNLALINGYGSYGAIPYTPDFLPHLFLLLKRGVVLAFAHVRGGGEKGNAWHLDGKNSKKPNTWKDFNACSEYLIRQQFTASEKLSCMGGSAGGILIGRAVTERPDLYKVAIPKVGCLNAIRMEFSPNGPINTPEFGSVINEDECLALIEMDATYHTKEGTKYPSQLVTTGFNDPRVISWGPAKYAAAMQATNSSTNPVLLYVNFKSGHFGAVTTTDLFVELAKTYAFMFWQCEHPDFQPRG